MEWVNVWGMEKAVETVLNTIQIWWKRAVGGRKKVVGSGKQICRAAELNSNNIDSGH